MKKNRQLGICMDHSNARLMEVENGMIVSTSINSGLIPKVKTVNKDTHEVHSKEHHQLQSAYYKEISEIIRNYQEVLLFGPTDAKNELLNLIDDKHHFENIKIDLKETDKMTDNEMDTFVLEFYK